MHVHSSLRSRPCDQQKRSGHVERNRPTELLVDVEGHFDSDPGGVHTHGSSVLVRFGLPLVLDCPGATWCGQARAGSRGPESWEAGRIPVSEGHSLGGGRSYPQAIHRFPRAGGGILRLLLGNRTGNLHPPTLKRLALQQSSRSGGAHAQESPTRKDVGSPGRGDPLPPRLRSSSARWTRALN